VLICLVIACGLLASINAASNAGTNWAVIIAGSNTYMNYRHQADVCHSYQILKKNGFPDSNIIVFMYDDIANNSENPVKGNIINKPNGPNVYTGVPKDYTGNEVTAKNFLAVLAGDKEALKGVGSGKTLNSGPNDNVFIFFSDHGGPGLIAMPNPPYLYAKDLSTTLKGMATNKRFGKLVFYLEACESGSMFTADYLPTNINIYATSASGPEESSYACYWDDTRQAYLGDLYSVSWMENADAVNVHQETLEAQFVEVRNATNLSHVMQWGQLTYDSEPIGDFLGFNEFVDRFVADRRHMREAAQHAISERHLDAVDSRDVTLATLRKRLSLAKTPEQREIVRMHLELEESHRKHADDLFRSLTAETTGLASVDKMLNHRHHRIEDDCLRSMIETVEARCGRFTDYSLKYMYVLNNMCGVGVDPETVRDVVTRMC